MNDKALVEISVPAAGEKFDFFIPLESRMSDVLKMVSAAVNDLTEGRYKATEASVLCDASTGTIFNINMEIAELGITNGSRLMLI